MKSYELKTKFLDFFRIKGHKRIKNSSLIPENDSSALFINSGMHPIVNYLMGEKHPLGTRLMNYQRALRTGDIENVGLTKRHHTFFEMLGEWSLGDYWKRESLNWSVEFIVNILGLDPKRLYATVFKGDYKIPQDKESIEIWIDIFKKFNLEPTIGENFALENCPRIVLLGRDDNFWPKGK
ncbi:MAG: alanine--tRNA ligase-related protein, partial [Caldisericia bacterium]|nr:alanine--tRNA ligase-related protein [Caldisericia bacterium]